MSGAMPLLTLCVYGVKRDDVTCKFIRQSRVSFICALKIKYQLSHGGKIINA